MAARILELADRTPSTAVAELMEPRGRRSTYMLTGTQSWAVAPAFDAPPRQPRGCEMHALVRRLLGDAASEYEGCTEWTDGASFTFGAPIFPVRYADGHTFSSCISTGAVPYNSASHYAALRQPSFVDGVKDAALQCVDLLASLQVRVPARSADWADWFETHDPVLSYHAPHRMHSSDAYVVTRGVTMLVPEHLPAPGSSAVLVPEFYLYLPVDHEVLLATPATPPQELLAELVA